MVKPIKPGWWFDALLIALFIALTVTLATGHLLGFDQRAADWADQHRPTVLYWIARAGNILGQGGWLLMPLTIILAGLLAWRRHSIRPLLVFLAAGVLTYLTIGPLKIWMSRDAPSSTQPTKVELFNHQLPEGGYALGYPSGHVANALVWYGAIALLASALLDAYGKGPLSPRARLALRAAPPAILFCTTTYLSFHWVTDSVAGLFLGLVLTRLMARVDWDEIPLPAVVGDWGRPAFTPPVRRPATPV